MCLRDGGSCLSWEGAGGLEGPCGRSHFAIPTPGKGVELPTVLLSPQVLPCLLRPFSHVLYHLPLGTVTSLVQQLTNLPQSAAAPTNLHLTAVLQNKVLLISTPSQPWKLPQQPLSAGVFPSLIKQGVWHIN